MDYNYAHILHSDPIILSIYRYRKNKLEKILNKKVIKKLLINLNFIFQSRSLIMPFERSEFRNRMTISRR